jgi:hypothetical protein
MTERSIAVVWMIFGVGFYSFTIGNLSSIIKAIDTKTAHLQEKLHMVSEFTRRSNMPSVVEIQIKRFLEHNHQEDMQNYDQAKLLSVLPSRIRA